MEEAIQNLLATRPGWPGWLTIACLLILGAAAVWLLVKILKWTLYLALAAVLLAGVLLAAFWLLG